MPEDTLGWQGFAALLSDFVETQHAASLVEDGYRKVEVPVAPAQVVTKNTYINRCWDCPAPTHPPRSPHEPTPGSRGPPLRRWYCRRLGVAVSWRRRLGRSLRFRGGGLASRCGPGPIPARAGHAARTVGGSSGVASRRSPRESAPVRLLRWC